MSALAFRSKSYWQYDAAFLERVRPALTLTPEYVMECSVFLMEINGLPTAFYGFCVLAGEPFLHDFWVDPSRLRTGIGRLLWDHAVATARAQGYTYFLIESDPNAERFYIRMGAEPVGERVSPDSSRLLPLLRYAVKQ